MKLLELFKRIFKKDAFYSEERQNLACLNDIIPIPKREEYSCDHSKLELIDTYKSEYLRILKHNKTFTTLDLTPEYLCDSKNFYIDLLTNLCTEDTKEISFDLIKELGNPNIDHLDKILKCIKLMIYQKEIASLEEQTLERLIALNEIVSNLLNGRLFTKIISKKIINTLLSEMNNLQSTLIVFMNHKRVIQLEIDSYIKEAETLFNYENINKDEKDILESKLEELKNILKSIDIEELNRLESMNLSPKLFIASIEIKLEIYVSTHKETINSLRKEVENLSEKVNNNSNFNLKECVEKIKDLEIFYKVFSIYGRNLVTNDDLKKLYEVKFKLLTYNILDIKEWNILDTLTFTEFECYQEIIFKIIENILKGNNTFVNNYIQVLTTYTDIKTPQILECITKPFKDENNDFSAYKILTDKKTLSFLLAIDSDKEYGLRDFFNKTICEKKDYPYLYLDFYYECFSWEEFLPLSTIYRIIKCNLLTDTYKGPDINPLFDVYLLYEEVENNTYDRYNYRLPIGLTDIDFIGSAKKYINIITVINYIRDKANNKTLILPDSLKLLAGNIFEGAKITEVIMNNLYQVRGGALYLSSLRKITFSSSLIVSSKSLYPYNLKTITIKSETESNTVKEIAELLSYCYEVMPTTLTRECYNKNKRQIYRLYKIIPSFDEVIIEAESNEITIFYKKDFIFTFEMPESGFTLVELFEGKINFDEKDILESKLEEKLTSILKSQKGKTLSLK